MEKAGFVTISGQPNVGKSTILNGLLKEKLAIVTRKAETTRDNIRGILTDDTSQIIFTDTPGISRPHDLLGKIMLTRAQSSIMEADIILFVTEKRIAFNAEDEGIIKRLPEPGTDKIVILVINKADRVKDKRTLLPLLKKASEMYPFDEIVPMSALNMKDIDKLLKTIKSHLKEGPFLFPGDEYTDKDNYFLVSEIIREKILTLSYREVPHSVSVVIDEMVEKKNMMHIYATIFVERVSQKSIIIGKNGDMMKKIGELARLEIEKLLSKKVNLDLWVKVYEKWKKDPNALKEMGYSD
ncbi:MAG: GTPase Era [Candidatus Aadella gelida]|nr:GTPase Era [Candidatus Aadella gelida]